VEDEERQAFLNAAIDWVEATWGETACPYCGNRYWEVGSPFVLETASRDELTPHFPVMCSNCGNTVLVNAFRAGLLPEPDEE